MYQGCRALTFTLARLSCFAPLDYTGCWHGLCALKPLVISWLPSAVWNTGCIHNQKSDQSKRNALRS